MDNRSRIITLDGEVNEGSALQVILSLLDFDSDNKEPIYLYINSPGGSIIHGLAIYDVINYIDSPVYTVCYGMAASMGAFLLSCGEKGHRYALKHSRILIHQPLISTNRASLSSHSTLKDIAESLMKNRETLETIMAENSSRTLEEMHDACERDNWMSSDEALKFGLIDEIIE